LGEQQGQRLLGDGGRGHGCHHLLLQHDFEVPVHSGTDQHQPNVLRLPGECHPLDLAVRSRVGRPQTHVSRTPRTATMRLPTACNKPRSGTHAIECAVVYPFTFAIILATIVGGLGIYRYQQMAFLSREISRYCATHGGSYIKENQNSSHPTSPTGGALS